MNKQGDEFFEFGIAFQIDECGAPGRKFTKEYKTILFFVSFAKVTNELRFCNKKREKNRRKELFFSPVQKVTADRGGSPVVRNRTAPRLAG